MPDLRAQSTEFVNVIRLVNCYIAIYIQGNKEAFISKHPEIDIKIAQATAKLFAENNNIPSDRPIITVLKYGQNWFPAELHANTVTLLASLGPLNLGGSQQEATNMANGIALSRGSDCIPSIGISLEQ